MQSRNPEFVFSANFDLAVDSLFDYREVVPSNPLPPPPLSFFLLLDTTDVLLLDGTNFLLLGT
jgi:hypothetical protein